MLQVALQLFHISMTKPLKVMHKCSVCKAEFDSEKKYLDHICTTTFSPSQFEHQVALNPHYKEISDAALARGAK